MAEKEPGWVILLAQLPAAPSSGRVTLWRHMRAAGAARLVNGAWALPATDKHQAFFQKLADAVRDQSGHALLFHGLPIEGSEAEFLARLSEDRAREYEEFDERCAMFSAEINKETRLGKFTFAELEEIEDDFDKLAAWLAKIEARDFFPDEERRQGARGTLLRCAALRETFAAAVYEREGLESNE